MKTVLPFLLLPTLLAAAPATARPQHLAGAELPAYVIDAARAPVIDGSLDETVWRAAPVYDTFHKHEPRDGKAAPAHLRTTVQLLIDDGALVFGVRAWDPDPARLRGALARRDKVDMDQDFIGFWIDPTGHGRAAQFVRINTAGVFTDGVYRADDDEADLGPDFPIDAAVRMLPDGYSMEVRWPLSSLRFPYAGGKNWRAMVERNVPHAGGLMLLTVPLKTDALNYIATQQEIGGMGDTVNSVRDRRFVEIRPELTLRSEQYTGPVRLREDRAASLGIEINARPRADWVFNATLNPDFSQVEIDQPTSSGAGNIALSLPEKRAFFLESSDVLGLPLAAFYSRAVAFPEWGVRATWRAAQADATAMSLRDQQGGVVLRGAPYETKEFVQTEQSLATLWRTRWHGSGLLLGAFGSQRDYGSVGKNLVAGIDGQWRGNSGGGAQRQAALVLMGSQNTSTFHEHLPPARTPQRNGGYLWGKFVHSSNDWWNEVDIEAISPGFVNDNGFVPQAGIAKVALDITRKLGQKRFGTVEMYQTELLLDVLEVRTLADSLSGQPGNEVVQRQVRPGFWFQAARQTDFWAVLGFDQQRARRGGKLHDVRALHFGGATSPLPWISKISGEVTLGRQLDVDADRVGHGGQAILDIALRFRLPRGWSLELDQHFNRAWVEGTLGHPSFADNGWRWLAMLHTSPRDSFRLLAQNTRADRRDDGVTQLDLWAQRQEHRSLLYRHLWRHGRSMSVSYSEDDMLAPRTTNKTLTMKFQWEL